MAKVPSIEAFKELNEDSDDLWRVIMLGEVHLNSEKSTEMLIDVLVAPLKGKPKRPDKDGNTNYEAMQKIRIGVGQLPYVFIGSVWHHGLQKPFDDHQYQQGYFKNLRILDSTTHLVTLGHKVEQGSNSFHLVGDEYEGNNYWPDLKQVSCVTVTHRRCGHKLIVPTAELIRFYFVQSTRLAQAVFMGDIHNFDSICNEARSNPVFVEDGKKGVRWFKKGARWVHKVHLRQTFHNVDSWIIARLRYSRYARRMAKRVHDSLMDASNYDRPAFPKTTFPFFGRTNLRVLGRWLKGADDQWRFLAYRILECSGHWDFDELIVGRDNDGRSDNNTDSDKLPAFPEAKRAKAEEDEEDDGEIRHDEDPTANVQASEAQTTLDQSRFTPIKHKRLSRAEKEPTRYKSTKGKPAADDYPDYSTGKETSAGTSTKAKHFTSGAKGTSQEENKVLAASFEVIVHVLEELNKTYKVSYEFINPYSPSEGESGVEEVSALIELPLRLAERERRRNWAYLSRKPDKVRRAVIAELILNGRVYYLFELERRPGKEGEKSKEHGKYMIAMARTVDYGFLGSLTLVTIMRGCVRNRGIWLKDGSLPELRRQYLKHTSKDIPSFAKRIYDLMTDDSKWLSQTENPQSPMLNSSEPS